MIVWTQQSAQDISRLHRFLAIKDQDSAKRALVAIRSGVKVLLLQPGMGRPSHDMDAVFREWVIDFGNSGYIVKYHFNGADVTILAVRHQLEAGYLPD